MSTPQPISDAGLEQLLYEFSLRNPNAYRRDVARIIATLDRQTRRLNAALAVHQPRHPEGIDGYVECAYDLELYPCATVAALTAE